MRRRRTMHLLAYGNDVNDDRPDLTALLRRLVPLHAIATDGAKRVARRPGRPPRARRAPDFDQRQYLDRVADLRRQWVEQDGVVRAIAASAPDFLDRVQLAIAEEVASLRFTRDRLPSDHGDVAALTGRILQGLVKIAEVLAMKSKLGSVKLDLRGPQFAAVYKSFFELATEAAVETMGAELAGRFLDDVRARMVGWEEKAEVLIR